jgi:acyl carrier protein
MNSDFDREAVFEKLRGILVEVLSIRPGEVAPAARIVEDLGAESIDLLDLRFRLERTFGFQITSENLAAAFGESLSPAEFRTIFTVGALCDYVGRRLEGVIA